jgi:hypothetical protein
MAKRRQVGALQGPFSVTRNWPLPLSLSGVIVTHEPVTLVTLVTLGSGDWGMSGETMVHG